MSINQDSFTSAQKYGRIQLTEHPRGPVVEGNVASGNTIMPGMFCSKNASGLYTLWNGPADGGRDRILIALEYRLWGKGITDNYTEGQRIKMYEVQVGDILLARYGDVGTGTGDDVANQARLMIEDGTGKLMPASSEEHLFLAEEAIVDPTADQHLKVRFVGY